MSYLMIWVWVHFDSVDVYMKIFTYICHLKSI